MDNRFSLMIHGGAGALDNLEDGSEAKRYLDSVHGILEQGRVMLAGGATALQTVEACVSLMEDEPLYNAGRGSVLNEDGKVELDAAIMDGSNLSAGAVACVTNVANPIKLARLVMTNSEHVLLTGEGAKNFARHCDVPLVEDGYFLTQKRLDQLQLAKRSHRVMLDHENEKQGIDQKFSTVGAVARDLHGNLAAATSTGGLVNKRWGRVGDSPIVGAGVYADNETCAVSATGYGEDFMRTVLAKTVADYIYFKDMNAIEAARAAMEYFVRKVNGRGGVIVIDKYGNCAKTHTTKRMIHGWIEKSAAAVYGF